MRYIIPLLLCLLVVAPAFAEPVDEDRTFFQKVADFFTGEERISEPPTGADGRQEVPPSAGAPETGESEPGQGAPPPGQYVDPQVEDTWTVPACDPCHTVLCEYPRDVDTDEEFFVCRGSERRCEQQHDTSCDTISCFKEECRERVHTCYDPRGWVNPQPVPAPMPYESGDVAVEETMVAEEEMTVSHKIYPVAHICRGSYEDCREKYGWCDCGVEGEYCEVDGRVYRDGQAIPTKDCNSCFCDEGSVTCTQIECGTCGNGICDPGEADWCPSDEDCEGYDCPHLARPCYQGTCPSDCERASDLCEDTDGKNYYVKGTVKGLEAPGVWDTWTDYCGFAREWDNGVLLGDSEEYGKLVEYVCDSRGYGKKILYDCPNGCADGRCIREGQSCPTEIEYVCAQPPMPKCLGDAACIQVMPSPKTYDNKCFMEADGAEYLYAGKCREDGRPDFHVAEVEWSPRPIVDGTIQKIEVNVRNNGPAAFNNWLSVELQIEKDGKYFYEAGTSHGADLTVGDLEEFNFVGLLDRMPAFTRGTYVLRMTVDPENLIAEGNERNNVYEEKFIVGGCEYNGRQYDAGESFTASDGCNTCSCGSNGQVMCTLMACAPPRVTYTTN